MMAAAPIAEPMAPSLRMKSRIATPFFHPPLGDGVAFVETTVTEGGAASAIFFPLPLLLVLLDSGLVGADATSSFFESITTRYGSYSFERSGGEFFCVVCIVEAVTCVYIEYAQRKFRHSINGVG